MKVLYPLAALLSLGSLLPAAAQQTPAPLPAARPAAMTHDDSVAVLHQLFHRERHHGRILAIVGGAVLPLSVVSIAKPSGSDFQRGIQTATTIVIGAQTVGSIVRWVQFSKRREREAVRRFEQRQVQPLYVQRAYALLLIEKGK